MNKPYYTLRFMARLIEYLGWAIVVLGWIWIIFWYTTLDASYYDKFASTYFAPQLTGLIWNLAAILAIVGSLVLTLAGIIMIAFGQLLFVFIDIRDDTHKTMQEIRRLGLIAKEDIST